MTRLTRLTLLSVVAALVGCGKDSTPSPPPPPETTAPKAPAGQAPGGPIAPAAPAAPAPGGALPTGALPTGGADAVGTAATGQPPTAPIAAGAPLTQAEVELLGGRMLAVMDSLAGAVAANASDCGAMATAVEQVLTASETTLAEMKASSGGSNEEPFTAWMTKNAARIEAINARIAPGLTRCAGEPRMYEAVAKLGM